jgi:hypothetical protein
MPLGPATTIETHNYIISDYIYEEFSPTISWNFTIPDSIQGATACRLIWTMYGAQVLGHGNSGWSSSDKVTVNGASFAVPVPKYPSSSLTTAQVSAPNCGFDLTAMSDQYQWTSIQHCPAFDSNLILHRIKYSVI